MRHSQNYNLRLPERLPERNDPADIDDLTYDIDSIDGILKAQDTEDKRLERDKAKVSELNDHKVAAVLDHPDRCVTDAKIGNRTVLTTSGLLQTLLTAIGNAIKAITGAGTWNAAPPVTLTAAKAHVDSRQNPHVVTKAQVELGSADDTSDVDKPVSTAQAEAIQMVQDSLDVHKAATSVHLTEQERALWNTVINKANTSNVLTKDNAIAFTPTENYHPATKKYIDDQMGTAGSGDMMKAVYDQNGNGIVDNAEKVNGLTVQTAVPAGAKFTDTVYTHPGTHPASMITGLSPASVGLANVNNTSDSAKSVNYANSAGTVAWGNVSGKPGFVYTVTYSATIGTAASQNIGVSGITASDTPIIDVMLSGNSGADLARLESWGSVSRIYTYNGGITVICYEQAPSVAIPIQLKVVR